MGSQWEKAQEEQDLAILGLVSSPSDSEIGGLVNGRIAPTDD